MDDSAGPALIHEGATVLVGPEHEPRNVSVVIEQGEIGSLHPPGGISFPARARVLDVSHMTLMPAFIDAHVHIGFYEPRDVLAGGVTTVRDLAWPPERIFPLAEASKAPGFDGPEILTAGPMLTAPGGYPTRAGWAPPGTGREVASATEAAQVVGELVGAGVDVIKVALNEAAGPTLPTDVLEAIVEHAHGLGLKVTGHVTGLAQLDKALDAGLDELAHMLKGTDRIPDGTLGQMVAAHMAVVPTLAPLTGLELEVGLANLTRFLQAGGKVIYGTDLGDPGPQPGIDPLETGRMGTAGMTALEIVASATAHSARWLGLTDRGTIEEGMRADIIGIPGDLTIEALPEPAFVMRRGSVIKAP